MKNLTKALMVLILPIVALPNTVSGQSAQQQGISNTTQILDTSVLFAIGAREAEQAIRGSFGWPTFQEGFVDKVYFRFDPDGYARFSSSPRLDEDVFEVICAESSTACLAKKESIEIGLTSAGQIQIRLPGITPEDSFFLTDRKSELPVPPTILEPLDARLETLLASSADLIVKRQVETVQTISLSGFSAVVTYLRWVAQGQNSRVFPRGWPVPAQGLQQTAGGLTQPDLWNSPNTGPQQAVTTFSQQTNAGQQQVNAQFQQIPYGQNPQFGVQGAAFQQPSFAATSNINGFQVQNPIQAQGAFAQNTGLPVPSASGLNASAIDPVQEQILALQTQLANLQSQNNAADLATAQSGAIAEQTTDDFGQSFAEQAQGRSLPIPSGFSAADKLVPIPENTVSNAQALGSGGQFSQAAQPMSAVSTHEVLEMQKRIYVLETALQDLRHEYQTELSSLRWMMTRTAQNSGGLAPSKNTLPSMAVTPTALPQPVAEVEMSPLEKLLLERLGRPEVTPSDNVVSVDSSLPSAKTDPQTDLVSQLLQELQGGTADVQPIAEPVAVETTVKPIPDEEPEFVTLSDYINEVLKSESQKNAQ
ncbi:hypothetical protein GCM10007939_15660 [Amylibacter marinus]|uniref:Uncharacterized protein n=1 Tax=Amylibacter marinus TaxID=1475483 RepID=A0ABQ5VVJ1_9RHOB|nr:hypothetical protein [Amylibacter marinus]GLQ35283.1 hypothetical protein GCM10007939_15660 [Amylibacter marinus]